MRDPHDPQTAMYYAHAYEQRALAMQQSFQGRGAHPHPAPHRRPPSYQPPPWPR
jgi:hypothetical protein